MLFFVPIYFKTTQNSGNILYIAISVHKQTFKQTFFLDISVLPSEFQSTENKIKKGNIENILMYI